MQPTGGLRASVAAAGEPKGRVGVQHTSWIKQRSMRATRPRILLHSWAQSSSSPASHTAQLYAPSMARLSLLALALALALICPQAYAAPAAPAVKQQNVPAPTVDPLANLSPPEVVLAPGLQALNLTQLAPLLPLLSRINGSVVQTWIPVFERVDQNAIAGMAPILNALTPQTVEGIVAALPYVNLNTTLALLPAINAIPPANLVALTKVLGTVDPRVVDALVPSIAILDPAWINKVVPAMAQVDPNYLVAVVSAIAPVITKVDPNSVVALLPALNSLSVDSWRLTIDLMSRITPAQLELLIHLLDVTGPYMDQMVRVLNWIRAVKPFGIGTFNGRTTVYTKPSGTVGMQPSSRVIVSKQAPTPTPAPVAPSAPAVRLIPIPGLGRRLMSYWRQ